MNKEPFSFKCPHCDAPLMCRICSKEIDTLEAARLMNGHIGNYCTQCGGEIASAFEDALAESLARFN